MPAAFLKMYKRRFVTPLFQRCSLQAFLSKCFWWLWWSNTITLKEQQNIMLHGKCSLHLKCEKKKKKHNISSSTLCMCPWRLLLHLLTKPRFAIVSNAELLQSERMSCALFWCMHHQQNCQLHLSHCALIIGGFRHEAGFAGVASTQTVFLFALWANKFIANTTHKTANMD